MITSVRVKTGFAAELKYLKDRTFKFTEGLNILYGPNGSGKTTLLRILGAYSCCWHKDYGGWSRIPKPPLVSQSKYKFPSYLRSLCVGECSADVGWDGTPAMYHEAGKSDNFADYFYGTDLEDSPDGLNSGLEQLQIKMQNPSAGQLRMYKLKKLKEKWGSPPDLTKSGSRSKPFREAFCKYIEQLPRGDRTTLLLDEPGRGLSFENQFMLWAELIPSWAEKSQIIVATHSILPGIMDNPDTNIIELVSGYQNQVSCLCLSALSEGYVDLLVKSQKQLGQEKQPA